MPAVGQQIPVKMHLQGQPGRQAVHSFTGGTLQSSASIPARSPAVSAAVETSETGNPSEGGGPSEVGNPSEAGDPSKKVGASNMTGASTGGHLRQQVPPQQRMFWGHAPSNEHAMPSFHLVSTHASPPSRQEVSRRMITACGVEGAVMDTRS